MILGASAAAGSAIKNAIAHDCSHALKKPTENPFRKTVIPNDITQDISMTLHRMRIGRRHF